MEDPATLRDAGQIIWLTPMNVRITISGQVVCVRFREPDELADGPELARRPPDATAIVRGYDGVLGRQHLRLLERAAASGYALTATELRGAKE